MNLTQAGAFMKQNELFRVLSEREPLKALKISFELKVWLL